MISVSGEKQLLKQMEKLSKAAKNKVGKKAITAGVKLMAKAIKREIPSNQKSARKAIGYGYRKPRSGKFRDMIFAKAGGGVGMKKNKREKEKQKAKNKSRTKPGVGISSRNVHWLLAGTKDRSTGSKRVGRPRKGEKERRVSTGNAVRFTGRMKRSGIVQRARKTAGRAVEAVIFGTFAKELQRELAKST